MSFPVGHRGTVQQRLDAGTLTMPNGCHEWQGATSRGYGVIKISGKVISVHRLTWTLTNGPIPEGMCVMHTCDNPPCRNIQHLQLGTQADNLADMDDKGRRSQGQHHAAACRAALTASA